MRARLIRSAGRVAVLGRRAAALFPVRVWRRFLRRNGFLLSAGMAYQTLFAVFGLLYVGFAAAGVWLGGSSRAIGALIDVANSYLPGIIGPDGIATVAEVHEIAANATGAFTVTGVIATAVVLWTGVSAVTFTRRAVRGIFGLPFDARNYVLLKIGDALAAAAFGLALLVGAAISFLGVWTLRQLTDLLGWQLDGTQYAVLVRAVSIVVVVVIDAAAIAALVHFLTGTSIRWRTVLPGATAGGAAVAVLQLGAGLLLTHTPGNPLLATFAVMVAMLLWCRFAATAILLAASWIALTAEDADEPLERPDAAAAAHARLVERERRALNDVRDAEAALASARWWRRRAARADLMVAREEWEDAAADVLQSSRAAGRSRSRARLLRTRSGDVVGPR